MEKGKEQRARKGKKANTSAQNGLEEAGEPGSRPLQLSCIEWASEFEIYLRGKLTGYFDQLLGLGVETD